MSFGFGNKFGFCSRLVLSGINTVTNGTFDVDANWSKEIGGWSISLGVASCNGLQVLATPLSQDNVGTVGDLYSITFDVPSYTAGSFQVKLGDSVIATINAAGSYSFTGIFTTTATFTFLADADYNGSLDNVVVEKVINT